MKLVVLVALVAPLLSTVSAGVLSGSSKPDLGINIKFPEANPFSKVKNGDSSNLLLVRLANQAGEQLVISSVHGQYYALGDERPLRNTTNLALRQIVLPGLASPLIRYKFHSENKVGPVGLKVWVDYLDAGNKPHTAVGFKGVVNVIEPKQSWFDLQLGGLYLLLGTGMYFLLRLFYKSYLVGKPVKSSISSSAPLVAKRIPGMLPGSGPATPTPAPKIKAPVTEDGVKKSYDEDWIPESVIRSRTRSGKSNQGVGGGHKM